METNANTFDKRTIFKDFESEIGSPFYVTNFKLEYLKVFLIWFGILVVTSLTAYLFLGPDIPLIVFLAGGILSSCYLTPALNSCSDRRRLEKKLAKDRDFRNMMNVKGLNPVAEWLNQEGVYSSAFEGFKLTEETDTSLVRERSKDLLSQLKTFMTLPQPENTIGWAERPYYLNQDGEWVGTADRDRFTSIDFVRVNSRTVRVAVKTSTHSQQNL